MQSDPADEIGAQIEAIVAGRTGAVRFPAALETRHEADTGDDRHRTVLLCAVIGLIVYDAFIIADLDLIPDSIWASVVARFLVVTPLSLVLIAVLHRRPPPIVRETIRCVMTGLCVATILVLMVVTEAPLRIYQHDGIGLVLLYPAVAQRVDVRVLAPTLIICVAMFIAALDRVPEMPAQARQTSVMILIGTAVFVLICAHNLERQTRLSYVLGLRMRRANRSLAATAKADPLTRLVDRLGFDERFAATWRSAHAHGRSIAVVMIDLDHSSSSTTAAAIRRAIAACRRRRGACAAPFAGRRISPSGSGARRCCASSTGPSSRRACAWRSGSAPPSRRWRSPTR